MNQKTKKLTTLTMLCAIAYLVMFVTRIPIIPAVPFLKYEPKDVIITMGGFIFGPLSAFCISLVVSIFEMLTASDTGIIGLVMNVLATCSFACVASWIYKKNRSLSGAVIGLVTGSIALTGVMILWNYLLTPMYMGVPRQAVVELLLPAILPFNLLKAGINSALIMLLYKPVINALRKMNLVPASTGKSGDKKNLGVFLVSGVVLATLIMLVLVIKGIL